MKVEFHRSFERDIRKIRDRTVLDRLRATILAVENADDLESVPGVKPMQGYAGYFRLRIGDFRLGIKRTDGGVRVIRFRSRGEIYRKFP